MCASISIYFPNMKYWKIKILISSNSNINIHENNTRNEIVTIVSQFNNTEIINERNNLQCIKAKISSTFWYHVQ